MTTQAVRKPAKIQARLWLFPLATLYAITLVPLSVLSMLGQISLLPGLANPHVHAHELIFGFAFPVISGYLLGAMERKRLGVLITAWLLARLAFWMLGFHPLAALFSALAAVLLGWQAIPSFWKAKRWQNQSVAVIALLYCLVTALAAAHALVFAWLLPAILIILCSLMFFMGGRIITPLLSSYWLQFGKRIPHNIQPRLESAGLILLALALLLQTGYFWPLIKGSILLAAGAVILVRWLRWQPWQYRQLDITWLFAGYLGLGAGVILLGLQEFMPRISLVSTHTITVAAMGVLMVSIMARVNIFKAFKNANALPASHYASALLVMAAAARLLAPLQPAAYTPLLYLAMLGWSLGFGILLWILWRCRQEEKTKTG